MEKSEDPITMYLIVRESINMSIGKTAAQCAHAAQMLQIKYAELHKTLVYVRKKISAEDDVASLATGYDKMAPIEAIYEQWLSLGIRKVVLSADEKDWNKLLLELDKDTSYIVKDAGLTELAPGTDTVIGLWPIKKSQASKTVKRLQVLK